MAEKEDPGGDDCPKDNDDQSTAFSTKAEPKPFLIDIIADCSENINRSISKNHDTKPTSWRNRNNDIGEKSTSKPKNSDRNWRSQNRDLTNHARSFNINKSGFSNPRERHGQKFNTSSYKNKTDFEKPKRIFIPKVKPYDLSLDKLKELKDPQQIMLEFIKGKDALKNMFLQTLSPNVIVELIKLFAKMCPAKLAMNLNELFLTILDKAFMNKLEEYIIRMPLQTNRNENQLFWGDVLGFFEALNTLCLKMFEITPQSAVDYIPQLVKTVDLTATNLSLEKDIVDKIQGMFEEVRCFLDTYLAQIAKKKRFITKAENELADDFHDIDVYPNAHEINTPGRPFLRRNKIEGAYKDAFDYLDVQFRLLKEDFVGPLREAICEYLDQINDHSKKRANSSIKVYRAVHIISTKVAENQVVFVVQLEESNRKLNLANSKRFMFGTLLCFTTDNFKSITFGKVISNENVMLNRIEVGLEYGEQLLNDVVYMMAECKVYFEPYFHVLTALTQMNPLRLPMSRYLVDVDMEGGIDPPKYTYEYDIGDKVYGLNPSQFDAYEMALSSEFSIIQGPPGTGKTYLGLKVAQNLLLNYSRWKSNGPMLVICFTNHALDQFLGGILKHTDSIVRIGGQCQHLALKEKNIRNLRWSAIRFTQYRIDKLKNKTNRFKLDEYECEDYYDEDITDLYQCNTEKYYEETDNYFMGEMNLSLLRTREFEVKQLASEIASYNEILEALNKYNSIISFSHFEHFHRNMNQFWVSKDNIMDWLSEDIFQVLGSPQNKYLSSNAGRNKVEEKENTSNDIVRDYLVKAHMERFGLDSDDNLLNNIIILKYLKVYVSLSLLRKEKHALKLEIDKLSKNSQNYGAYINEYNLSMDKYNYFKLRLEWLERSQNIQPKHIDLDNPYNMTSDDRWLLYGSWLKMYKPYIVEKINKLNNVFRHNCKAYNECKDSLDIKIMKHRKVIGMTTTAAARMQSSLEQLQCPIVIVEEAAEILESHIVAALSSSCQQLILIGDHKQLKPATADYKIESHYHLGISLFERMVNNNFPCKTLNVQHRMRPEISRLITPAIYENLKDHESVKHNIKIPGISVPVYFINHEHPEMETNDSSKENHHEAIYFIKLAKYLVLNNVDPETITIIVAYSGQLFLMLREKRKYYELDLVKIVVLDNYQGEENNIILLSLVRNNKDGSIGFLSLENRVCVALSRARHALYIMGNMNLLCENSKIWPKIRTCLRKSDSMGNALSLCCENHQVVTKIEQIEDFDKVQAGGCLIICEKLLDCGHFCDLLCHISPHTECLQSCKKTICEFGHLCPGKCFERCRLCMVPKRAKLPCGHEQDIACHEDENVVFCKTRVSVTLPCGHDAVKQCNLNVEDVKCRSLCDAIIESCGHKCKLSCHFNEDPEHVEYQCFEKCEKQLEGCTNTEEPHKCTQFCYKPCESCNIIIRKKRTACPHFYDVACSMDVDELVCVKPCKKILNCGHKCGMKCKETCGGCKVMLENIKECGHKIISKCNSTATEIKKLTCRKPCKKILDCGHTCKNECGSPCGNCAVSVKKIIKECGHTLLTKCWEEDPSKRDCVENCSLTLSCGHPCKMKCRKLCDETKCTELLDFESPCGHIFQIPCNANQSNDESKQLSYCKEKCTEILECKVQCKGSCKLCSQGRMHIPCESACMKILLCSHRCTLFCKSTCKPCQLQCSFVCAHSRCKEKCCKSCTECYEQCNRKCKHQSCNKNCHEICSVPSCKEPCKLFLKCNHPCIGYCGEPCPKLCKICNREKFTQICPIKEDEENSRFVYLEECEHVFEGRELEEIFKKQIGKGPVGMLYCPKCNISITKTQRFSDYIKLRYKDLNDALNIYVKTAFIDKSKNLEKWKKNKLESNFLRFGLNYPKKIANFSGEIYESLFLTYKCKFFKQVCKLYADQNISTSTMQKKAEDYMTNLFTWMDSQALHISKQQFNDYNKELRRTFRVMQFCKILDLAPKSNEFAEYEICDKILFSCLPYTKENEVIVTSELENLVRKAEVEFVVGENCRKEMEMVEFTKGHWFKCDSGHIFYIGDADIDAVECDLCENSKMQMDILESTDTPLKCVAGPYLLY